MDKICEINLKNVTTTTDNTNTTIKGCGYRGFMKFSPEEQIKAMKIIKSFKNFLPLRGTEENEFTVSIFTNNDQYGFPHVNLKISKRKESGVLKGSMRSVGKLTVVKAILKRKSIIKTKTLLDLMTDFKYQVHHVDSDIWNNEIQNLMVLTVKQHSMIQNKEMSVQQGWECHKKNVRTLIEEFKTFLY
jgi:hypothetical protein